MKSVVILSVLMVFWGVTVDAQTNQLAIEDVQALSTDESVFIRNVSSQLVDLTGWSLTVQRPGFGRPVVYAFPDGCIVPGRGELTIHSGPANVNGHDEGCGSLNVKLFWQAAFTLPNDAGIIRLLTAEQLIESEFQYPPLYTEEDVRFGHDGVVFAGTLTVPNMEGRHPAVVLVSGSGPQDRDSDFFGFKSFRVIADHLSKNGFVVLRYDDRGVGGSSSVWFEASLDDRVTDVMSAIGFLKQHPSVDRRQIGIVGHSEGGVVGPMVAAQSSDVAFMVMIAGVGTTGAQILIEQSELLMRAAGATEEAIATQLEILDLVLLAIRTDDQEDWANLRRRLQDAGVPNADQQIFLYQTPWFRSFVAYDPQPYLEKIQIPVLSIFGSLDLQVPHESNQAGMETGFEAAGNTEVTYHLFERANHLFQLANTGSVQEYSTLPKRFIDGFLDLILDWLYEYAEVVPTP